MCLAPESGLDQVSLLCMETALCLLGKGRSREEGLDTKDVGFFVCLFFFKENEEGGLGQLNSSWLW